MIRLIAAAALALGGCATTPAGNSQDAFFADLSSHCGTTIRGNLVSKDPQDASMAGQRMSARFESCTANEVRINFAVGDDRSRNWVISRTAAGLRLKHIHLHEDGSEDALSRYGGDSAGMGTARRQEFPADAFSKALFSRQGSPQSLTNVWAMEAGPQYFAYELRRPEGRFFRVEFTEPIPMASTR